jgi:hypothetical protein
MCKYLTMLLKFKKMHTLLKLNFACTLLIPDDPMHCTNLVCPVKVFGDCPGTVSRTDRDRTQFHKWFESVWGFKMATYTHLRRLVTAQPFCSSAHNMLSVARGLLLPNPEFETVTSGTVPITLRAGGHTVPGQSKDML